MILIQPVYQVREEPGDWFHRQAEYQAQEEGDAPFHI